MTTLRPGTPEEAGMSPARVENLRRLGAKWAEDAITPAVIMLVARRGVVVLHEAYGRLTPDTDSPPLRPDSIVPLTSVTKPVTATCVMMLVEDGLLGLNRPLQEYIPEFQGDGKANVLVHHLLTHTSGLTDEAVLEVMDERGIDLRGHRQAASFDEYLERLTAICDTPLSRPPGEEMSYSNFGYQLLGELVRRVSGQPLEIFAPTRVFEPLGMKDTLYPPDFGDKERARTVVREGSTGRISAPEAGATPVAERGAGSLHATALDLAILGQTFLNGGTYGGARILGRAAVHEMTRNQVPGVPASLGDESHREASWGYGWGVRGDEHWTNFSATLDSPDSFGHSGVIGITFAIDPERETVLVCYAAQSVVTTPTEIDFGKMDVWRGDLFVNAALAAIED
jgi:CubicO group peptidase (beta-lactamase class C family)